MKKTAKLPTTHPGEILLRDFLEPLGLIQYALAKTDYVHEAGGRE